MLNAVKIFFCRAYSKLTLEVQLTETGEGTVDEVDSNELASLQLSKNSEVIVGGVPNGKKLPSGMKANNFFGSLNQLNIDDSMAGLWNWEVR